jgi:hypothetical protein
MRLLSYKSYDECGHRGIEVLSHFVRRLWRAGIDGQLLVCPEIKYSRYLMELSPLTWEGSYGYCKQCQEGYAIRLTCLLEFGLSIIL